MFARLIFLLGLFACLLVPARADVVKPALIEISANVEGRVSVEIRASLEALLTGINARYQNTREAPKAAEYDAFRVLEAEALREAFEAFVPTLLGELWLRGDDTAHPSRGRCRAADRSAARTTSDPCDAPGAPASRHAR